MVAEIHHNHVGNRPGRGGGVGVLGRTITGVSLGFGSGVTSRVGVGTGDRVGIGSGRYGIFGGYPRDSSANTAAALSNNRITTLSHIADLWVEYAFMGVLLSSLAASQPNIHVYLKCVCRRIRFVYQSHLRRVKYFSPRLHIE
jgi:hypothetical protein